MIDWDQVVLVPNFEIFGEPATYFPASGLSAFDIEIVFDRAYTREYLMDDGMTRFTSVSPTAGIRVSQFDALGVEPKQNDRLYIPRVDLTFIVHDYRVDSHGGARLFLNRT